jgi:hypothetical protein
MGAQITPMKNGDSYGSPFFIGVICAPIGVFYVPMQLLAISPHTRNTGISLLSSPLRTSKGLV